MTDNTIGAAYTFISYSKGSGLSADQEYYIHKQTCMGLHRTIYLEVLICMPTRTSLKHTIRDLENLVLWIAINVNEVVDILNPRAEL